MTGERTNLFTPVLALLIIGFLFITGLQINYWCSSHKSLILELEINILPSDLKLNPITEIK